MFPMVMMAAGLLGTLVLVYVAFAGPSPAKAQVRRLESLRERHSKSTEIVAQAQLKKIMSGRPTKMDGVAQRFLPNPALLRKRIEQTGKPWSIGQYLIASVALAIVTRSEEHTSELQSLMHKSYAVFCLKKTNKQH